MLFKDSDTLKIYAALSGEVNLNSIKVTMEGVEMAYLYPRLGKELYNSLQADYAAAATDATFGTELQKQLLDYCRKVIAPLFCYHFAPKTEVRVSDSGVHRSETSSLKAAYQYQGTRYREENFNEGQLAIENLLQFLEDNIASFPTWASSVEFQQYRSLFIKTATAFNQLFPSAAPQRNYFALRPKMVDVQEVNIRNFLGDTLYESLLGKAKANPQTFTAKEKVLLERISKAIAYYTVAFAAPFLAVKIGSAGITITAGASFSSNDEENTRAGVADNNLRLLIESCNNSGAMWIEQAAIYMKNNEADFASWTGFPVADTEEDETPLETVFGLK